MVDITDPEWVEDCMRRRGKVLRGIYSHWCGDRAGLPVDETSAGWPCMHTEQLINQVTLKRNFERMTSFFIQINLDRLDTDMVKRFFAAMRKDPVLADFLTGITATDQDGKAAAMPYAYRTPAPPTPLRAAASAKEQAKAAAPKKKKPKKKPKAKRA
jgi:hypothetical protein